MKYNSLLENWNKFLNEQEAVDLSAITDPAKMTQQSVDAVKAVQKAQDKDISPQEERESSIRKAVTSGLTAVYSSMQTAEKEADVTKDEIKKRLIDAIQQLEEAKEKKAGDRCTRIAKRKYKVWPSAYASGAVVKCRQGKIWKGISENATDEDIDLELLLEEVEIIEEKDPKVGTGKKPKGSDRRLYTDENPKDTVSVKYSTVQDIKDTLSKQSFKSKSHARQSQIINLIHQRVRVAHERAKDPEVKARLKNALEYAEQRKEASKKKTDSLQKENQNIQLNEKCWDGYTQKGMKTMFGKRYPNCVKKTNEEVEVELDEIDLDLLLEQLEAIKEEWSDKYKRSIDCNNPKGFSQKAHCQGRNKNEQLELDDEENDEILDEAKKKRPYKPNFSKEKKQGLHGWFARNKGKGWINCRTGGPCGRSSADKKGGKYPACRPTKAQCKSAGKGPLRKKKSSKPISWVKKKKKD